MQRASRFAWMMVLLPLASPGADPPPAFEELVRRLGDASFETREQAFQEILDRGAGDPKGMIARLPAASDDPEVQRRCDLLRKLLPMEPRRRRALDRAGSDEGLRKLIEEVYGEPSAASMESLCSRLRESNAQAAEALSGLLLHPDADVRLAALKRIFFLRVPESAQWILPLLDEEDANMRQMAVYAIGQSGNREAAPSVAKLAADPDKNVRMAVCSALSQLGAKSESPRVAALLEDTEWEIRQCAVEALGQMNDPSIHPQVAKLLTHANGDIRFSAAQALEKMKARGEAGKLLPLLEDPLVSARNAAATALSALAGREMIPRVAAYLESENRGAQRCAAGVLARLAGEEWPEGENPADMARLWWAEHKDDPEFQKK